VNRNNVVPFDPSIRSALARRGAPDKSPTPLTDAVEIECGRCSAAVAVDLEVLYAEPEIACGVCGAAIPLHGREWVEGTR
jgi:DNA-directed RNA polymerase subunit RPC12/RpoP